MSGTDNGIAAGAGMKQKAYWVFTIHDGYISFRTDSGYTGSTPFDIIPGGKTPRQKAAAYARWVKLSHGQYEIIDARDKKNPRKRRAKAKRNPEKAIQSRKREPRNKVFVRSNRYIRRIGREQLTRLRKEWQYRVQIERSGKWINLGAFANKPNAVTYGQSVAAKFRSKRVRVVWDK